MITVAAGAPAMFVQDAFVTEMQRVMIIAVLVVLAVITAAAIIVIMLIRRRVRQRVETERLQAMGIATARILHQVKNPLQSILLHAEMLADGTFAVDEDTRDEAGEAIVVSAGQMEQLLAELSAYASGVRRRLERERLPLHRLVEDVAREEAKLAASHGLELRLSRLDAAEVDGDSYFLRQAVRNVVRNARDAVHRLDAGPARVHVALRVQGESAVIEVRDNGPGIASDDVKRVFEPFVTTKTEGMGLGLAICREIIEGHGGRVRLRSTPGEGTVVDMSLPLVALSEEVQPA